MNGKATQQDINIFAALAIYFGFMVGLLVGAAITARSTQPLLGIVPLCVLALVLAGGFCEIHDALPPKENK